MNIICGDCLEAMQSMADNSVDSIVTDSPYELGFMGKSWDNTGIAYSVPLWREALRVLKPGGYLLAFGGCRTYHRMAVAIEDAGFVIHPLLGWVFGSGFPKATDLSKQFDKQAGAERDVTTPSTDLAKQWDGWKYGRQSLKPAIEPICMAQKPHEGKMTDNVAKYGTGAINVDGCRVGTDEPRPLIKSLANLPSNGKYGEGLNGSKSDGETTQGRYPANLCHDGSDEVIAEFPMTKSGKYKEPNARQRNNGVGLGESDLRNGMSNAPDTYGDSGSTARFFYSAKASQTERDAGLESLDKVSSGKLTGGRKEGSDGLNCPAAGAGRSSPRRNFHPTVKPIKLMQWLVRLVTPPEGTVLDPFMGSGSTGCACVLEGFNFIGCELEPDYIEIAKLRIQHWQNQQAKLFK